MEYILVILILSLFGTVFIILNLLKKVEKYEEDILLKDEFIEKFQSMVEDSQKKIKELDIRGSFEADDEVGYFFKSLKDIILALDVYYKNYVFDEEDPPKK